MYFLDYPLKSSRSNENPVAVGMLSAQTVINVSVATDPTEAP